MRLLVSCSYGGHKRQKSSLGLASIDGVRYVAAKSKKNEKLDKLPPSPVKRVKGARIFVSNSDEVRVMGMIPLFNPKMRDYVCSNIAVAMEEYRIQLINECFHASDTSEVARARKTSRALLDAAAGLESLGRDAVLHHVYPVLKELEPIEDRGGLVIRLRELAEALDEFLKWTKPSKGRQPLSALREFIASLYCIYWEATRKAPGVSSKPEKKPGKGGLSMHGPFTRFCLAVVELVNPSATESSVYELAREATRRLKNSGLDRNFVPTDKF
jgi:hypothetical protein